MASFCNCLGALDPKMDIPISFQLSNVLCAKNASEVNYHFAHWHSGSVASREQHSVQLAAETKQNIHSVFCALPGCGEQPDEQNDCPVSRRSL